MLAFTRYTVLICAARHAALHDAVLPQVTGGKPLPRCRLQNFPVNPHVSGRLQFYSPHCRVLLAGGVASPIEHKRHSRGVPRAIRIDHELVLASQGGSSHFHPRECNLCGSSSPSNCPRGGSVLLARVAGKEFPDLAGCALCAVRVVTGTGSTEVLHLHTTEPERCNCGKGFA
jgi:hypothetical protein